MGCESSHEATNPLPPSSKSPKVVNAFPQVQWPSIKDAQQKNEVYVFQRQSVTPSTPTKPTVKQPSLREKSYIAKSKQKMPIEETVIESDPQSEPEMAIINAQQLIKAMVKEMRTNPIYDSIIEADYLCKTIEEINANYLSKDKIQDILQMMMAYMSQARHPNQSEQALHEYIARLGRLLLQIKQQTTQGISSKLKVLQYLRQNENHGSFLDFKFDMNELQVEKMTSTVKGLLKYDWKSAYFVLIYIQISTQRLLKALTPIQKIEERINKCIAILSNSQIQLNPHPSITLPPFPKPIYNKKMIDFKQIEKDSRGDFVQQFVKNCAVQTQKEYLNFRNLLWNSGSKWGKTIQISLFNKSDLGMLEAKRSIADVQMEKVNLQVTLQEIDELTLEDLYLVEELNYKEQLTDILAFIDAPIQFKTSFLMQARLYFQHTTHILEFITAFQAQLKRQKLILMKVVNRTKGADISEVVIQVNMNGVCAEVHLILNVSYGSQHYNVFIKLLTDNRNFTYLSHLKMIAQSCLPSYLSEMKQVIKASKGTDAEDLLQYFNELESLLPFAISLNPQGQTNSLVINEGVRLLESFKRQKKCDDVRENSLSRLTRMIELKRIMNDPSAELMLNEFYHSFQQRDLPNIELRLQENQKLTSNDIQLLKKYAQHIKQVGLTLFKRDFIEKAKQKFEAFIRFGNICQDELMKAEGRRCLALLEHKKGNFNRALQIIQKCLQTVKKMDKDTFQLPFIQLKAKVYADQQKFEDALNAYGEYLDILTFQEENKLKILQMVAQLHYRKEQWEKALRIYKQCLQIQQKTTGFDSFQCTEYLLKISQTLNKLARQKESLETAQRCLRVIQASLSEGGVANQISVRKHLASLQLKNGNYAAAVEHFQDCLQLIEQSVGKFNEQYGGILQQIGQIYQQTQAYQESLSYYERSLVIKQRIDRKNQSAHLDLITKIAKVHEKLNNTAKCIKYQVKIGRIEDREQEWHSKDHVNTFINIAKKSLEKGNYPLCLKYYQKSLVILEQQKGKDCIECIPLLKNMGLAYKLQGHLQESIRYFSDSLTLVEKHKGKNNIEAAQSYYEIGNIYATTDSFELAETYFSAALHLCNKFNVKYTVFANSNLGLGDLYFKQQLYSKAFECYERSLPLLEKLYPKLYMQAVQNMEICDREIQQQFPHTAEEDGESSPITAINKLDNLK